MGREEDLGEDTVRAGYFCKRAVRRDRPNRGSAPRLVAGRRSCRSSFCIAQDDVIPSYISSVFSRLISAPSFESFFSRDS
jgi:hypothetical protein